jgi:uncharacterized protein (TIGR03437 family)
MVSVRVSTEPSGPRFTVDGLQYTAPQTFRWPVGSKHVIAIVGANFIGLPTSMCTLGTESAFVQYEPGCEARYQFSGWDTTAGSLANSSSAFQVITADKDLTFVRAKFSVEYKVAITFVDRPGTMDSQECQTMANYPGPPKPPGVPGVVYVGGSCLDRSTTVWVPPGELSLQAIPFDRFVFRGWTFNNTPLAPGQLSSYNVKGPTLISPRFEPGKRVMFHTEPYGLNLRIDNTTIHTVDPRTYTQTYPKPGLFDWLSGSQHVAAAISPQIDIENNEWVFWKWSNGGGQDMPLRADYETNIPLELTAKFVPAVHASFVTEPAGLKLNINGRDNWPTLDFVWGVGLTYDVVAPVEQTDARGRKYVFKGWSNGGPAAQKIVPEQPQVRQGLRMTALFEAIPQAVIETSVPGLKVSVDGAECVSPCKFDRPVGTVLNLQAQTSVVVNEVSRYEFTGWSDGNSSAARTFTVPEDSQAIAAMYRAAHKLVIAADPGEGATFKVEPSSEDGFYPGDSQVTLSVETKPGFKFRRWGGALEGTINVGIVSMSSSRVVTALLDRVPFVEPAGVRNAAAELAEPVVAPGLVAIYGGSLSRGFEVGPASPLVQTLGGTVVLVEDRILPLVYVSPEQINAQLPADLEPGEYNLTVRSDGMADVSSTFIVVRNAPGLFSNQVDGMAYAAALHEDGSPVTAQSPAKRNETVTLLGTGFGPYNRPVIDGFATPASPAASVVDPVEVIAGAAVVQPAFSGAAPGLVGLTATRFRLDSAAASGPMEIKVKVNGKESNTVILPVE